jgi:hypothetical protein
MNQREERLRFLAEGAQNRVSSKSRPTSGCKHAEGSNPSRSAKESVRTDTGSGVISWA